MLALLQLFGGIRRYLEQYPDGGFSKEIVLFLITSMIP